MMPEGVKIACIVLVCCIGVIIGFCFLPEHPVAVSEKPTVEIVKIRDCDYVFWENGYGLDMEHYAGCVNPDHTEFREDVVKGMRLMWEDAE